MNYHDPIVLKACKGVAVTKLGPLLSPTNGYGVDILYNSVLICFQLFAFQIDPPKPKRESIIFILNLKSAFEKIFVFHFKDLLKCIFIFDRRNSFNIKRSYLI